MIAFPSPAFASPHKVLHTQSCAHSAWHIQGASTWSCGQLPEPHCCGGECNDGEVVAGGFLEAGSDAAELLELAEAALEEVALSVEMFV